MESKILAEDYLHIPVYGLSEEQHQKLDPKTKKKMLLFENIEKQQEKQIGV
jgi:hypothetical protein